MPKVIISREDVTDFEDVQVTTSVLDNTTNQSVQTITTKNAMRAFLVFVGQAWDPALDTFLTWRVKKDGAVIYQLKDSKVQIAAPNDPSSELVPWIELPQQCTLKVEADVSGAGTNGTMTSRLRIYYVPVNPYKAQE